MIRRIRAWWRRVNEHWHKKREIFQDADRALRALGYGEMGALRPTVH